MILGVSGHRPSLLGGYEIPNPTYDRILIAAEKALLELAPEKIITGMALGFDTWIAELAIKLGIPFVAAVPFINQEVRWHQESQEHYRGLLKLADSISVVSPGEYAAWKMQTRNQFIVDQSDTMLACYNGDQSGGTYNCLQYARQQNKEIRIIDPNAP